MSGASRQTLVVQRIRDEFNALRASLAAGRIKGDSGKNYRLVSGVLRNSGSGWDWINDTGHAPSGFGAVTQDSGKIMIAHAVSGLKVSSLQITPDETYAARGLRCGASVGIDSSNVYLYTGNPFTIGDRVYYNGTTWVSENGVYTMSYAASVLTLTHESMGAAGPDSYSIVSARGTAFATAASVTDTTTQIAFYTGAFSGTSGASSAASTGAASTGTAHTHVMPHTHTIPGLVGFGAATTALNAHVVRHGIRSVPATNPSNVSNASGNLWVTGLIEIAP